MAKYTEDAKKLLELVGGKANIQAVSHCMTRMRFVLADEKKADTEAIGKLPSVKGTFTQAGQYQVIIGNDVAEFYNEFTACSGIEGVSKEQAKEAAKSNQSWLQKLMSNLGEIFAPLIPALICGGLILGIRNIIGDINFFDNGTKSLADISQFWAGTYQFLWLIGEAVFHLLPVGIVWSITKKMGTTQILGIILGLTLVSSQLLNGFSVADTSASVIAEQYTWDFGFAQVRMIGYQGQVIAAMMAGFVLVYLEKFFRKITPAVVSMIVVPVCSLLPAVIIAHTIVGPIGWTLGNWIADGVSAGLTSNVRFLFAAAFGLLYAPVVMTGLHHMTNAIDSQLVTTRGGTILWPMIALSNIAQGSSVLAMAVLQKKNERAKQVNVPSLISCYLGVTEPALFGVNLKYGFPLICGMIGSCAAAVISVGCGVEAASIGVGGLPGILSIKSQFWGYFLLAMAVAVVVPFVLTLIVGKKKLSDPEKFGENSGQAAADADAAGAAAQPEQIPASAAPEVEVIRAEETEAPQKEQSVEKSAGGTIYSPADGKIIPLSEIPDQVFSQGIMGDGVGIEPSGDTVYAPADGTVAAVMEDSKHACGIVMDNGMELLIHIGIDTVDMNGDGFTLYISQGDRVKKGDRLIGFSPEKIKAAGHPMTTAFLISGEGDAKNIQIHSGMDAKAGETAVFTFE